MAKRDYFLEDYLERENVPLDENDQPPPALNAKMRFRRAINEMLGLCKGLIADGQLVDSEIQFLNSWFSGNQEVLQNFPAREIYARIQRIYADGVVTEEEREDLKELLASATGDVMRAKPHSETPALPPAPRHAKPFSSTTLLFDDPEPKILFPGQSFSFTGKFITGTRTWCVQQISARGAVFQEKPKCEH